MQMGTHFSEAIFLVETPTGCILLEDIKFKKVSNTSSMVHQLSPNAHSMEFGIDEDCPHLIANKSDKSDNNTFQLKDPCFSVWQVESKNILPLLFKKSLRSGKGDRLETPNTRPQATPPRPCLHIF